MTAQEYNTCVDLYADRVYRFIAKNSLPGVEAEDIVQNAFEILWRNIEQVPLEKSRAYLFSVAHHNLIDHIRRAKRMSYVEDVDEELGGATRMMPAVDLSQTLNNALAQLSEVQRSVVLLRDYEGYSYDEIAQITQLTESQVKVYIFRARKKLQQILVSPDLVS